MNVLAYVAPPIGDRAMDALIMLVKGIVMVFVVLTVLMLALKIMERFFVGAKNEKPKKIEKPTETEAPIVATSPETTTETNDGALVAAITAAISVVLASEQGETSVSGFRVVSFKRVGGKSAWNVK